MAPLTGAAFDYATNNLKDMTAPNLSQGLLVVQILFHLFILIVGKFLILGIEFFY
jgi:hypothetical protein